MNISTVQPTKKRKLNDPSADGTQVTQGNNKVQGFVDYSYDLDSLVLYDNTLTTTESDFLEIDIDEIKYPNPHKNMVNMSALIKKQCNHVRKMKIMFSTSFDGILNVPEHITDIELSIIRNYVTTLVKVEIKSANKALKVIASRSITVIGDIINTVSVTYEVFKSYDWENNIEPCVTHLHIGNLKMLPHSSNPNPSNCKRQSKHMDLKISAVLKCLLIESSTNNIWNFFSVDSTELALEKIIAPSIRINFESIFNNLKVLQVDKIDYRDLEHIKNLEEIKVCHFGLPNVVTTDSNTYVYKLPQKLKIIEINNFEEINLPDITNRAVFDLEGLELVSLNICTTNLINIDLKTIESLVCKPKKCLHTDIYLRNITLKFDSFFNESAELKTSNVFTIINCSKCCRETICVKDLYKKLSASNIEAELSFKCIEDHNNEDLFPYHCLRNFSKISYISYNSSINPVPDLWRYEKLRHLVLKVYDIKSRVFFVSSFLSVFILASKPFSVNIPLLWHRNSHSVLVDNSNMYKYKTHYTYYESTAIQTVSEILILYDKLHTSYRFDHLKI
ncbi:hypothetical protein EON71_00380 [bacterium]|nr:MAG: hypothetical protein EON71_00380 [bacterium]